MVEALPTGKTAGVIGRQLLRSGKSVGVNHRAACRAKSPTDFIHKMSIMEEDADESLFWMELIVDAKLMTEKHLKDLKAETKEILAITITSIRTVKRNKKWSRGVEKCLLMTFIPHFALRTPH